MCRRACCRLNKGQFRFCALDILDSSALYGPSHETLSPQTLKIVSFGLNDSSTGGLGVTVKDISQPGIQLLVVVYLNTSAVEHHIPVHLYFLDCFVISQNTRLCGVYTCSTGKSCWASSVTLLKPPTSSFSFFFPSFKPSLLLAHPLPEKRRS